MILLAIAVAVPAIAWSKQPGNAVILFGGERFYIPPDLVPHATYFAKTPTGNVPLARLYDEENPAEVDEIFFVFGRVKDDRVLGIDPAHLPRELLVYRSPRVAPERAPEINETDDYRSKERQIARMVPDEQSARTGFLITVGRNAYGYVGPEQVSPIGDLLVISCGGTCITWVRYDRRTSLRYTLQSRTKPEQFLDVNRAVMKIVRRLVEYQD